MAARSRTASHEQVIGLKNGSGRSPKRRGPLLLRSSSASGNLFRPRNPRKRLLTIDAKTIMEHGQCSIGIESNVRDLVDQVVVARPLTDNPEIVNERLLCLSVLERELKAGVFCHPGRLILIAGGFSGAHDTLGLKMSRSTDVVAVDRKRRSEEHTSEL